MRLLRWSGIASGMGHTRKHYLNVCEMWDDVGVAERPYRVIDVLDVAPVEQLSQKQLQGAYDHGYWRTIETVAGPNPLPWFSLHGQDPHRMIGHLGQGIVMVVVRERSVLHAVTAFRPMNFKLRDPHCPPQDAKSVSLRRRMAVARANRHLAQKVAK